MIEKTVLAIDPGTGKCGVALVKRDSSRSLSILFRSVTMVENLVPVVHQAHDIEPFSLVILGSGTGSQNIMHSIRENFASMGLLIVDEKDTSLQARERYWEHHPRRGWRKLLPSSLQVPPEPVDDFVAFILAERVLLEA